MPDATIYNPLPNLSGFIELSKGEDKQFRKEIIYTGEFESKGYRFKVTEADLEHWKQTFDLRKERGIEHPVPVGHTEDAEKRRGTVVALSTERNSDGRMSLFGDFVFNDPEDAKRGNQVSLYAVPKDIDGQGNTYTNVIKHVALTDYPVIPGLTKFEKVIAASLAKGENSMENLIQLLNSELGLEIDEAATEAMVFEAVKAVITALKEAAESDEEAKDDVEEQMPEEGKKEEGEAKPISASLSKLVSDSRTTMIDKLVGEGKITPAVAAELSKEFTGEKAISLAFSNETQELEDNFNQMVKALSLNEPVLKFGENTGPQAGEKAQGNALLANAEAQAEAAKL